MRKPCRIMIEVSQIDSNIRRVNYVDNFITLPYFQCLSKEFEIHKTQGTCNTLKCCWKTKFIFYDISFWYFQEWVARACAPAKKKAEGEHTVFGTYVRTSRTWYRRHPKMTGCCNKSPATFHLELLITLECLYPWRSHDVSLNTFCQNDTFEPMHEIQKFLGPKDFFWGIMKVPFTKNIHNFF